MPKQKAEARPVSVGFFGMLGLLFIGLKLAGIIGWSWWLVLLPLYGPLLFLLLLAGALVGVAFIAGEWK